MAVAAMNHFTVLTKDLDATRAFYVGILGLKEGYRPPLGFPGTWLYAGPQPVLHVIAGRDDRFFPVGFQRALARDRLGIEADVLPGGHLIALAQPVRLASYLLGA